MHSETSNGQYAAHLDVVPSPTGSRHARQQYDDTDAVTSSGQYAVYTDAVTLPPGINVFGQRNKDYRELQTETSGGQDVAYANTEIPPNLMVNLSPEDYDTYRFGDTSKDDILSKILSAEEYLGVSRCILLKTWILR